MQKFVIGILTLGLTTGMALAAETDFPALKSDNKIDVPVRANTQTQTNAQLDSNLFGAVSADANFGLGAAVSSTTEDDSTIPTVTPTPIPTQSGQPSSSPTPTPSSPDKIGAESGQTEIQPAAQTGSKTNAGANTQAQANIGAQSTPIQSGPTPTVAPSPTTQPSTSPMPEEINQQASTETKIDSQTDIKVSLPAVSAEIGGSDGILSVHLGL